MADAFAIRFDPSGAMAALDALEARAKAASRPAAQAGAQVLYDEVKLRAPRADAPHVLKSGRIIPPGALAASIYQVYSVRASRPLDGQATYHVSYNARKAPHGSLVEYGHVQTRKVFFDEETGRWYTTREKLAAPRQVAAQPYLRPAYDSAYGRALAAAKARWMAEMQEAAA